MRLDLQASIPMDRCNSGRHNYACSASDVEAIFWQQWLQYRDYLYRNCIKWMSGNLTDAEDALSRVMVKAWDKAQKYAGKIANFKAWLTKLTYNLCVDIYRERTRSTNRLENIEAISEEQGLISFDEAPESAMETDEKRIVIRHAINNLPTRLRETFILHFYHELSHQEIAQQQEISYQNVCKRISQSRTFLREELKEYFIGEDRTDTDKPVTPSLAVTESAIGENAGVEADAKETVRLPEVIEVARSEQHSESVMVAATSEVESQVDSDGYRWFEAALCKRQPVLILASAQFDKESDLGVIPVWGCTEEKKRLLWVKLQQKFYLMRRSPP